MEFLQVLGKCTNEELKVILGVVHIAINLIKFVIPIILIVMGVMDIAKAVLSSDDKKTKEAQKQFVSRIIYAIIIFLIPTIVTLLFNMLPENTFGGNFDGYSWKDCWNESK